MAVILGVDPGKFGAVAVILADDGAAPAVVEVIDMPLNPNKKRISERRLCDALAGIRERHGAPPAMAHLEAVGVRPGNGSVGMFSFGHATGLILGILTGLGVRVYQHTPQTWKGLLGLLNASKRDSVILAESLFPGSAFTRHDHAEAALIGYAGIVLKKTADAKTKGG